MFKFGPKGDTSVFAGLRREVHNQMPVKIDLEHCNHCGACAEGCPMNILQWEDEKLKVGDLETCIECGYCVTVCSRGAMTI